MDFGVQLYDPEYAVHRDAVLEAEAFGYSTTYLPDHFIEDWSGEGSLDTPLYDCLSVLMALAEATHTIRLGTHVVCTLFRHPAVLAKMWTTMDHISGGRVLAGVGAGWTKAEFDMMGIPFPDVSTRLRIMEEQIHLLKAFWTESRTEYTGEFFTVRGGVCEPKPVQHPHPPIMVGGNGTGIMRRAGRLCDMVNITLSLGKEGEVDLEKVKELTSEAFKAKVALVRDAEAKAGRPRGACRIACSVFQFMLTDSTEQTREALGNMSALYGLPPEAMGHMPLALVGTPDEMIDELRWRQAEWELDHVSLIFQGNHDHMRAFGERVLPAFL